MKRLLFLMLMALFVMACGEGTVHLLTKDIVSDAASCYESIHVVNDTYLVTLDKTCVDLELSGLGTIPRDTPPTQTETPIDWELLTQTGKWELLVTLPRNNLNPDMFRMVDEYIDPITSAYVDGKDFLFVIFNARYTRQKHFFLIQPEPPPLPEYDEFGRQLPGQSSLHVWHFPDPDAWWFQYWGNPHFQDRTQAGFTVAFDVLRMFEPSVPGVEKEREYLHAPLFGTSLDGIHGPGTGAAPEIKQDFELKIYVR